MERLNTGVDGLDDVLAGGLLPGYLYLLEGASGTGKTTLALQFLLEGIQRGERCLYISFSETEKETQAMARSHGWSLDGLALQQQALGADAALLQEEENTLFQPSEVELGERMQGILDSISSSSPHRLVIDSCTELRLLARTPLRLRRHILALKRHAVETARTVLLLDVPEHGQSDVVLQMLAHGVIDLEQISPVYGEKRRRLQVVKMRASDYRGGYHEFRIRHGGLQIFPRLIAAETRHDYAIEEVPSGLRDLDRLLGGGAQRGSSMFIAGPSGTGKSLLATQYVVAAAKRGEHAAYFAFDENRVTALARASGASLDLRAQVDAGTITLRQLDPAELGAGEFASIVREEVEHNAARVVVIDSLNGYEQSMAGGDYLDLQLHELLAYLGQRGVLTLLISAQKGVVDPVTPGHTSYLADTILLLRFFEAKGELRKSIAALKKRSGTHESAIRELLIDSAGIHIGEPLYGFHGILTGLPVYEGAPSQRGEMLPGDDSHADPARAQH